MWTYRTACPSRSRPRSRWRRASAGLPGPRDHRERRGAGHGRIGHRRRRAGVGRRRRSCRCRSWWRRATSAPSFVGDNTLCFAVSVLGQHRGDHRVGVEAAAVGARMVALSLGRPAGRPGGVVAGAVDPAARRHPHAPAGIGAVAIPPMVVLEPMRPVPRRQRLDHARPSPSWKRRRDQLSSAVTSPASRWRWPGIGGTIPLIYGGGRSATSPRCGGRTRSTRTPRPPPSPTRYPELCHNEICGWGQHGDVTRQVAHPGPAPPRRRAPPGGPPGRAGAGDRRGGRRRRCRRCGPRARGRWPSCSTSCCSATSWLAAPGLRGRRRPRPIPVLDAASRPALAARVALSDPALPLMDGPAGPSPSTLTHTIGLPHTEVHPPMPLNEVATYKVADLSLAPWGRKEIRPGRGRDARPHGPGRRVRRRPAA